MRVDKVSGLGNNELAILELIRTAPVSYFPPKHLAVARRLADRGLLSCDGQVWFPTRDGLRKLGITLH